MVSSGAEQPLLTSGFVPSSRSRTFVPSVPFFPKQAVSSCAPEVPVEKREEKGHSRISGSFLFLERYDFQYLASYFLPFSDFVFAAFYDFPLFHGRF
jgi:hypothetical protein